VFIARAMCGIECKSRRFVLQLQPATVSRAVTSSFVNERDPRSRELNPVQFICNSVIYYLCLINSSTLDVWIISSVAACPTPRLKYELRPSWNNIQDTFPMETAGYNTITFQLDSTTCWIVSQICTVVALNYIYSVRQRYSHHSS
jgi:hypothetical protein